MLEDRRVESKYPLVANAMKKSRWIAGMERCAANLCVRLDNLIGLWGNLESRNTEVMIKGRLQTLRMQ